MYLEAVSIGVAVPRWDFEARVHSIFRSSVNLQPENGNTLLTLSASNHGDLPQGIKLDAPDGFQFQDLNVGELGFCREGLLSFLSAPLRVDLKKARRWRCNLEAFNTDMTNPVTALAWVRAWEALTKHQEQAGAEIVAGKLFHPNGKAKRGVVAGKVSQAVRALVRTTRQNDSAAVTAARVLIGLGAGLTPSGDDLLVGYLAGLWCTVQANTSRREFVSGLGNAVIDLSQGTNEISRTYLQHAARGQVASHLAALAQAISEGMEPGVLWMRMEAALAMGHTSGMDTLTGLLVGLAVWDYAGLITA